jgi:hypothetical protein
MDAAALQKQVVAKSAGEARNVIYAVYQDRTSPARRPAKIILFIGGNLTGTSAGASSTASPASPPGRSGSTRARSAGARPACPRPRGAECAWADNDTFGVIASPTLSVTDLANELRTARSQIEHRIAGPRRLLAAGCRAWTCWQAGCCSVWRWCRLPGQPRWCDQR